MTTYYISGPMRSKPNYNFPQFHAVEAALWDWLAPDIEHGIAEHDVLNPARDFGGDATREVSEYMRVDLEQVLRADMLVLLPGWELSEGAQREVSVGLWTAKSFMLAVESQGPSDKPRWYFEHIAPPSPSSLSTSVRGGVFDEAKALITGDRNNAYGPPWGDFSRSAEALNAYGYRGPDGRELVSHDTAIFIMAVKLSRLVWNPAKRDSWVDIAGYAGCGLECALHDQEIKA